MKLSLLAHDYFFVLLGISGLLLTHWYSGPFSGFVHSYCGNLSASFACYFWVKPTLARVFSSVHSQNKAVRALVNMGASNWLASAIVALLVVSLFEATNGFRVMTNVYDPYDFLANTLGVALAASVGILASRVLHRRERSTRTPVDSL